VADMQETQGLIKSQKAIAKARQAGKQA